MTRMEKALRTVNKARVALGERPLVRLPRGKKGCSTKCPLANALGATVNSNARFHSYAKAEKVARAWRVSGRYWGGKAVPLTVLLEEFVDHFDRGLYKNLIKAVWPVWETRYASGVEGWS